MRNSACRNCGRCGSSASSIACSSAAGWSARETGTNCGPPCCCADPTSSADRRRRAVRDVQQQPPAAHRAPVPAAWKEPRRGHLHRPANPRPHHLHRLLRRPRLAPRQVHRPGLSDLAPVQQGDQSAVAQLRRSVRGGGQRASAAARLRPRLQRRPVRREPGRRRPPARQRVDELLSHDQRLRFPRRGERRRARAYLRELGGGDRKAAARGLVRPGRRRNGRRRPCPSRPSGSGSARTTRPPR